MIEEEILEGNKLIAEFIGNTRHYESTWEIFYANLKYHSSWDWLMPVWEKIFNMVRDEEIELDKSGSYIYNLIEVSLELATKIGLFYNITKFIAWYNTNQKGSMPIQSK